MHANALARFDGCCLGDTSTAKVLKANTIPREVQKERFSSMIKKKEEDLLSQHANVCNALSWGCNGSETAVGEIENSPASVRASVVDSHHH